MDRRNVNSVYGNGPIIRSQKTTAFNEAGFAGDAARECRIASLSDIPYDYVPPPTNLAMNSVPYKWPTGQEWSRSYQFEYSDRPSV